MSYRHVGSNVVIKLIAVAVASHVLAGSKRPAR